MLSRVSERLAAFFRATAPDPFVIAVLLTALTFVLALVLTDATARQLVDHWSGESGVFGRDGVWRFLAFSMQMCLILVTGHVLASSPPVAWLLGRLAATPRTNAGGAMLVSGVGCVLGVLNWGLGLVAGALLARRVHDSMRVRGVRANLGLLAAAGYTPMMVWHGGLSGSAPLVVTSMKDIQSTLGPAAALLPETIPLARTLFSPMNGIITSGLLLIVPIVMALMGGKTEPEAQAREGAEPSNVNARDPLPHGRGSDGAREDAPAGWFPRVMENTPIVNVMLALMIGAWAWGYYFPAHGPSGVRTLGLDAVNLTMLMIGLLLHGTPRKFLGAVDEAARGCGGIIIQFPLYAGIMGMMWSSGLAKVIAGGIAGTAAPETLPLWTFVSAAVVNLFIPSGGGQWAVQGPIALEAAKALGVDPARVVMAVAYGDQLTNMLQPFWALPLLAITGAKARDIIGYTAVAMAVGGVWIAAWMIIL